MTLQQSLDYLIARALDSGYTPESIKSFKEELRERLNEMPVTDKEELDELFLEIF